MAVTAEQKYLLNRMNQIAQKVRLGDLLEQAFTDPTDITLAEGNIFVGDNAGAGAALSAKGNGKILIGNGTTITSCSVTGIITLSNAGVTALPLTTGSILIGVGGAAAALDGKTSGQILVGNGTTMVSVAVSGDVSLSSAGAVAIGAGKVLESMLAVPGTDGLKAHRVARATFDATAGKVAGAYSLGVTLPSKAVITRAWYEVITTFTSAGADAGTIALSAEGADDIVAALAISNGGNIWDAGFHEAKEDGTAAKFVKLSQARALTATVAAQSLTAGVMVLFVEYVVSE